MVHSAATAMIPAPTATSRSRGARFCRWPCTQKATAQASTVPVNTNPVTMLGTSRAELSMSGTKVSSVKYAPEVSAHRSTVEGNPPPARQVCGGSGLGANATSSTTPTGAHTACHAFQTETPYWVRAAATLTASAAGRAGPPHGFPRTLRFLRWSWLCWSSAKEQYRDRRRDQSEPREAQSSRHS